MVQLILNTYSLDQGIYETIFKQYNRNNGIGSLLSTSRSPFNYPQGRLIALKPQA